MPFDFVEDPQRPQPRGVIGKGHDQRAPQIAPARDEQHQGREEQQEFGEGRRQESDGRLDPVEFRELERRRRGGVGYANHALQFMPERQRPIEHMQLVAKQRAEFGQPRTPFHQGRRDQPDHERDRGADRGHDQDRRYRAGNSVPLEKAGRRRQHGADHECRYDREEERLGGVENGDHANDQESDQGEGNDLRAADHRRQFGSAVRQRRADGFMRRRTLIGKDTQLALPRAAANLTPCPARATNRVMPATTRGAGKRFHRANVKAGPVDSGGLNRRRRNRGAPVAFAVQSITRCASVWGRS